MEFSEKAALKHAADIWFFADPLSSQFPLLSPLFFFLPKQKKKKKAQKMWKISIIYSRNSHIRFLSSRVDKISVQQQGKKDLEFGMVE